MASESRTGAERYLAQKLKDSEYREVFEFYRDVGRTKVDEPKPQFASTRATGTFLGIKREGRRESRLARWRRLRRYHRWAKRVAREEALRRKHVEDR